MHPDHSGNYTLMLVVRDSGGLKDSASVQSSVSESATGIVDWNAEGLAIPEKYSISEAYPNPFGRAAALSAGGVKIQIGLPENARVTAAVFNMLGQTVKVIVQDLNLHAGFHQIQWHGNDAAGNPAPNGIYFLNIRAGHQQKNIKISLLR